MKTMKTGHHEKRLLARGRCGRCAERVSPVASLRGEACPHCEEPLGNHQNLVGEIRAGQRKWRLLGYGLIGVASFLAGWIPLLQAVVQVMAIFVLHVILLRGSLEWLPLNRRILARLTMKIYGALVVVMGFMINVAVVPLVGLSPFLLALVGPLLTALYVEGGLRIVGRRIQWEAEGKGMGVLEWAVPLALVGLVLGSVVATVSLMMWMMHLLLSLDVPGVMTLATYFGGLER